MDPQGNSPMDLSLGKTWVYGWSWLVADSSGQTLTAETDTFQVRIASIHDTLNNFSGLIRVEAQSIPHFHGVAKVWYQLTGSSLVEIAYDSAGVTPVVLPKWSDKAASGSGIVWPVFSLFPKSIQTLANSRGIQDSIRFRDDIRKVYEFPLSAGKTWISFSFPFLETREIVGSELLERAGHIFSCAKIKTMLPSLDPNIEWYDDVAYEGLIERQIKYTGEVTTIEQPDGTGEILFSTESLTLISIEEPL